MFDFFATVKGNIFTDFVAIAKFTPPKSPFKKSQNWRILSGWGYFEYFFEKIFSLRKSCYFCNAFEKSKRSEKTNIP
jgi:hypothetical protein